MTTTYLKDHATLGQNEPLGITVTCVRYDNEPPCDANVEIDGGRLVTITWADRKALVAELQSVIDKYRI